MEQNLFVFDKNKCVGCGACAVACMNENGFQQPQRWRNIHTSNPEHHPFLPLNYISLACNHCDDAPCMKNCPAKAYERNETTGAIIHDSDKCIGCKYCTWACPFDAPKYNSVKGVVEKCTFCNHRLENGEAPACAHLCPTGALSFITESFTREQSRQSAPVPVDIGSHFKVIELRVEKAPEVDTLLFENIIAGQKIQKNQKINAVKEWPLVIFTLIISGLAAVAWQFEAPVISIKNPVFLVLGGLGAFLSTMHLGRKERAWRAMLNLKSSWLSKEIFLFSSFMAAILINMFVVSVPTVVFVLLTIALLLSIDMVYALATWRWPIRLHSALTVVVALALFTMLQQWAFIFLLLMLARLGLYLFRHKKSQQEIDILQCFRIISFVVCAIGLFFDLPMSVLLSFFLGGEIIDRIEFYNELRVPDPEFEIGLGAQF